MRPRHVERTLDVLRPGLDGRVVFLARADTPFGRLLHRALLDGGAALVFAGMPPDVPFIHLHGMPRTHPLAIPPDDEKMAGALAYMYGGKSDIVVINPDAPLPGGLLDPDALALARHHMTVNFHRPLMLARAMANVFRMRQEGGTILSILSCHARIGRPPLGAYAASMAAALSMNQALRAELSPSGIRIATVFHGPLDIAAHADLPPPLLAPSRLAQAVVRALAEGLEEMHVGDIAEDLAERFQQDPALAERELGR